jgi:adenosylmethionine-8-amino-7-oxononanoate aminotransferase
MTVQLTELSHAQFQSQAKTHLMMHFTRLGDFKDVDLPVITHGEGCWIYDSTGKRYLDGLSGLFCTQIGYSFGGELGEAARMQMMELPFYTNWNHAHPRSIELATKLASIAPHDLSRVFFVSGGSEANEAILKLVRQYHQLNGDHGRYKMIARRVAYHGTTYGALSLTGIAPFKTPFEPLMPGVRHISHTSRYRRPTGETEDEFVRALLDELQTLIEHEGPSSVAAIFIEPVQNAGGAITPPKGYHEGLRRICDEYGILLVADEVICGFGRLAEWFGSMRYELQPDLISFAKGVTSAHIPMGGVIISERIAAPFLEDTNMFVHGITFGGHPVAAAVALKNLEVMEREGLIDNVRRNEDYFESQLKNLLEKPIVGEIRGAGYFRAIELVKDKDTKETFDDEQSEKLLRGFLTPRLYDAGLICRADDREVPVISLAPPLVAGPSEIDYIVDVLDSVLDEMLEEMKT